MEVYLNVAETGIGTYGVEAGAQRYFGHDAARADAGSRPPASPPRCRCPRARGAVDPPGFTRRYGNTISARIGVVARDGLDACVYAGRAAPREAPQLAAPPRPQRLQPAPAPTRPLPGEEFEQPHAAPAPAPPPQPETQAPGPAEGNAA